MATIAVTETRRRPGWGWITRHLSSWSSVIALLVLIALWEILVDVLNVEPFTLPPPSSIVEEMWNERSALLDATWVTLVEVLLGFALSVVVGIPLALAIVYSTFIKNVLYPLFVSSQAIPRVAIAPLMVLWFGFGLLPKVLVAFSIALFPLVVSAVVGLQSVDRDTLYLARSMGAGPLQTFWKIRMPAALPSLFGGLKVAVSLAVIGAIVGEFVGAEEGLGYIVQVAQGSLNTALIFAAITLMALMGIVLFYILEVIERISISWYFAARGAAPDAGAEQV